jgi:hypothetical protein
MTTRVSPWRRTNRRCNDGYGCGGSVLLERTVHMDVEQSRDFDSWTETRCSNPECISHLMN